MYGHPVTVVPLIPDWAPHALFDWLTFTPLIPPAVLIDKVLGTVADDKQRTPPPPPPPGPRIRVGNAAAPVTFPPFPPFALIDKLPVKLLAFIAIVPPLAPPP